MRKIHVVVSLLFCLVLFTVSCSQRTSSSGIPESKVNKSPAKSPGSGDLAYGMKPEENKLPPLPPRKFLEKLADGNDEFLKKHIEYYNTAERDPIFKPFRVMSIIGLKPGDKIADIGAGFGYFTFRFSRVVGKTGKVYVVEVDEKVLKVIKEIIDLERKRGGEKFENIELIQCTGQDVFLRENSLDYAFMCWVGLYVMTEYHTRPPRNITDPGKAKEVITEGSRDFTKSVYNALKKDGKLIIIDYKDSRHIPGQTWEKETVEILDKQGFKLESRHPFINDFYFMIFVKK